MEWWAILLVALGLLLALFFAGLPIFVAFLALNVCAVFLLMGTAGFGLLANSLYDTGTTGALATVPLFILMGEILFRSGTVDVLFDSVDKLIGRLRGRQYILVVALSTLFGALSGSAVAVAAMFGRSMLPRMSARGYDTGLSTTVILGGASLAPIIPPSLLVIVIGSLVDVSIASLLIAGIVPGIILSALLLGYVFFRVARRPDLAPPNADDGASPGLGGATMAILRMSPFLLIFFSVMGLIMLGIATPSESAATGVVGSLITAALYRKLSFRMVFESLMSAAKIAATILVIVACSKLFSQLLSFTGATSGLVALVAELNLSSLAMMLILMAIPFFLCMFIDQVAFMLLALPIYEPIIKAYEFDPVWFWMLFLINLTVGSLTPPFGYTLFALKGAAANMPISQIFRAAWPTVAIFLIGMALLIAFPGTVTWLPGLF